jgi:opacity protein-like surface antigen
MRFLVFGLLLAAPALSRAQALATAPAVATQYGTLLASGASYGTMQFQLDVGRQTKKYLSATEASEARADQTALNEIFTVADALNLLSSHGWECIGVSSITSSLTAPTTTGYVPRAGSTLAVGQAEVQYLLRRRGQ